MRSGFPEVTLCTRMVSLFLNDQNLIRRQIAQSLGASRGPPDIQTVNLFGIAQTEVDARIPEDRYPDWLRTSRDWVRPPAVRVTRAPIALRFAPFNSTMTHE